MSNCGKWLGKKEFRKGVLLALAKANMLNLHNKWFINMIDTLYSTYQEQMADWAEDGYIIVRLQSDKAKRSSKKYLYWTCDDAECFKIY